MLDSRFAYLAMVISLFGSSAYFIATVRGNAQPNRVSFTLWTLIPFVGFWRRSRRRRRWRSGHDASGWPGSRTYSRCVVHCTACSMDCHAVRSWMRRLGARGACDVACDWSRRRGNHPGNHWGLAGVDSWDVPHVAFPAYVVVTCGTIGVLVASEAGIRLPRTQRHRQAVLVAVQAIRFGPCLHLPCRTEDTAASWLPPAPSPGMRRRVHAHVGRSSSTRTSTGESDSALSK